MSTNNCHGDMTSFHREKVTLSRKEQDAMRDRRDSGRTRLKNGLETAKKPRPKELRSQGSYQMRTMVQDADNDYDIDDGAYFEFDDLKSDEGKALSPLAARQRVCDALKWDGRFKKEATVKNNCVRQEYAEGYHIDVPVYRIVSTKDDDGNEKNKYELASGDKWIESDARAVTEWFNDLVGELNSGESDGSQMRRVTKLTKKFSRRAGWKNQTTSGICISKLIVDEFKQNAERDDISLRDTWKAVKSRLQSSTEIEHPVLSNKLAHAGDTEVGFFRDCLTDALKTLEVLDNEKCTLRQAREAWDQVFDTDFFCNRSSEEDSATAQAAMIITSNKTAQRQDGGGRFG